MDRYTVIWNADLQNEFTALWSKSDSPTRTNLTEIANWVDRHLAVDPESKGRAAPEVDGRIAYVPVPYALVTVTYRVLPDDRQVHVVRFNFTRG